MGLYDAARKINARRKDYLKMRAGKVLSPVRRIERVYPPTGGRFVAMTFDDGPDALPPDGRPEGLTEVIMDALAQYGAHGTFDIIGSTAANYPDEKGELGTFLWSGKTYDHYPKFGSDELAGAKNQPELVRRLIDAGHELSNHGSTHRLFGKMRAVYGTRRHLDTLSEAVEELTDLHRYIDWNFGYTMRLGRPAHYIDKIPDGSDAYDAYRVMGYNYLAASFDGAGWQPLGSYAEEVAAMVEPLKKALAEDPDALNGKIIFQKDGSNMAERTPIADAIYMQLKILADYGYQVVTVSELLEKSPFEDMQPNGREADAVRYLLKKGHTVGYKNNTFHGERAITADEALIMLARPEKLRAREHMTARDLAEEARSSARFVLQDAGGNSFLDAAQAAGVRADERLYKDKRSVKRSDAVLLIADIVRRYEGE